MTLQLWQEDFDELRARMPTPWAGWVARDVRVVRPWVGRLIGHVAILFGRLMVSQTVLRAPTYARRALLAEAWGRVVKGHLVGVVSTLLCFGTAGVLGRGHSYDLVAFGVAAGGLASFAWLVARRRSREAVEVAVMLVGHAGARAGATWRRKRLGPSG